MAVNKVVYGDNVLVDLTQDTVSESTLKQGITAHDKSGMPIVGSYSDEKTITQILGPVWFTSGSEITYTGASFTITKTTYVMAELSWANSKPMRIVIGDASSGNVEILAEASNVAGVTNSKLRAGTYLSPGTYYVWALSGSQNSNKVEVYALQ